jgi:hypothetical protein
MAKTKRKLPRPPRIKFPILFAKGDLVREVDHRNFGFSNMGPGGNAAYQRERKARWEKTEKGRLHIIDKVDMNADDGSIQYSTNRGAWYQHHQFSLVERASSRTLNLLLRDLRMETAGYYEEDEEL